MNDKKMILLKLVTIKMLCDEIAEQIDSATVDLSDTSAGLSKPGEDLCFILTSLKEGK